MAQQPNHQSAAMARYWERFLEELNRHKGRGIAVEQPDAETVHLAQTAGVAGPAGSVDCRYDLAGHRVHYSGLTLQQRGTDLMHVEGGFKIAADQHGNVHVDRDGQSVSPGQLAKLLLDLLQP